MRVLIIPEDQELDRYIVKPVIEALFNDIGVPAKIDVLPEPRLRGATEALDPELVTKIIADNPMEDLFLLIVDRDCNRAGNDDRASARMDEHRGRLLACVAVQEVEVWMLALHSEQLQTNFSAVRSHCDPKEEYADPLLEKLGAGGPGRGRKRAMKAIAGNWRSLRDRCTELRELQQSVKAWVSQQKPGPVH